MGETAAERRREYREVYLRSDHWLAMRAAALNQAGHRCQVCNGSKNLDVHHRTYERLGAERLTDLTVLCRRCHELFHGSRSTTSPKTAKKPRARKGKKVKISCAYCNGKNGRHETKCRRNEGERWWQEGIRAALEDKRLDKTGRIVHGRASWRV